MNHITTQTLVYNEHKEELRVIAQALDLLLLKDYNRVTELLVQRHGFLLMDQAPHLQAYNPREAHL